jgi:hypothetical protein
MPGSTSCYVISHKISARWFVRWPPLDLPLLPRYDFGTSEQRFVLFLLIFGLGALMIHALMRSPTAGIRSAQQRRRHGHRDPSARIVFAPSAIVVRAARSGHERRHHLELAPPVSDWWITVVVTFGIGARAGEFAGLAFGGGSAGVHLDRQRLPHRRAARSHHVAVLHHHASLGLGAINLSRTPTASRQHGSKKAEASREGTSPTVAAEAEFPVTSRRRRR